MTTGEKIRTVRQLRNMTQKQVGQKCGINEANLRKYESGTGQYSLREKTGTDSFIFCIIELERVG